MMHYRKGENVEKQLTKGELPFEDFLSKDTEFLWMHVNGGTKVNNVLTYAKNALDKGEYKTIVWSGNGGGVVKTISCAEILKRSVNELWKPQMEGLDEIVANRQIPSLHIFMSLEPIDDNVKGLQKPNTKTDFWVYNSNQNTTPTSLNNNSNYKSSHQGQRRFKHIQNKSHQDNSTNVSNNQEPSNSARSSSGGNQHSNHVNKQKRKRPNHNRSTENPTRKDNNDVNAMET